MPDVLPSLLGRGARSQSDSVGPREKFLLTLDRPIDHLTPDGLPFGVIRIEQRVCGLASEDESELPDQVIRVLDGGVAPQPVCRRMTVSRISRQEQSTF